MELSKEDKRIYTMAEEKPAKAVLKMGLPITAGMIIMVLYNLVDTYFIGLMHDDYQLAAVNLAYPIMMVMIAISNMVGTGAASYIARSMGAGDMNEANRTVTAGYVLTFLGSILIAALGLIFLDPIVTLLGAKENTFAPTRSYAMVLFIGSFFTMGNYTFGQLLRSEGSVRYSIVGMVVGTVVNMILDPIFIFGLDLEITGAAIATILGNVVGTVISVLFYVRKKTLLKLDPKGIIPSKKVLKEIFWVGIPATLETLLTSAAYVVNNNLAVAYGELVVAAMGVSQKLLSFGTYIYQGFAAGMQPLMGYNYGSKNIDRMLKLMRAGLVVTTTIEVCAMCIYGLFAPWLIGIFTETSEVISIGTTVMRASMFILPFVGAIASSRATFQAMGKPQYAFTITLVRQLFLYIPLLLTFNHFFGFYGLIWAQPVTEVIMMIASVTLLYRTLVNLKKSVLS